MMPAKSKAKKSTIEQVKKRNEMSLMNIQGVTGVGIGEDDRKPGRVIKVYVERATPSLQKKIPSQLEGYPVRLEQTGEFHAF